MTLTRRTALIGLTATLLSACVGGGTFKTEYDPVPAGLAKSWRLAEVRVSVPKSLTVSAKPTSPVTVMELMGLNPANPGEAITKLGVTVSAND